MTAQVASVLWWRMPVAPVTGAALHFTDTGGAGPVVLMLHGFPLSHEMWWPQVGPLLAHGFRVVTFDARGFGGSGPIPKAFSVTDYADDAASLHRYLCLDRVVVCGSGMGANAALVMAERHPSTVRALALVGHFRERVVEMWEGHGREALADVATAALLRRAPQAAVHADVRRIILTGTDAGFAAARAGHAKWRAPGPGGINVPVLVLAGVEDGIVPIAEAETFADSLPGGRIARIENAGHLSNLEQPAAFNRALLAWLNQLAGAEETAMRL